MTKVYARSLLLAGTLIIGPAMLFGPGALSWLLGPKWEAVGVIVRMLGVWWIIRFATTGISQLPLIVSEQRRFLMFGVLYNLALISGIFAGASLPYFPHAIGVVDSRHHNTGWTARVV
ncbi:MAG: hypothetical protein R3A47_07210 [Polyangiales bacterium]